MNWLKTLVSWPILAVQGVLLIFISWPWANHWVSYFWILIILSVLIGELLSKIFSPKKQTVSNNIRDESITDSLRFWAMILTWLLFCITLALHFMVRLF